MKLFLNKLFLYLLLPLIVWILLEGLLPTTTFTHRHSEAILFKTSVPHEFNYYPNINSTMNAVGDLCHHSSNEIIKKEVWRTDKLGFRNDSFIQNPDILIIGDSFTQGTGLTQDETISNLIKFNSKNQIKVYNMAPSKFSEFDKFLKLGIVKKPKLIVFSIVERNIPEEIVKFDPSKYSTLSNRVQKAFGLFGFNVFLDKAFKFYSIKWIKARIENSKGKGVPSIGNSNMYFLEGVNQIHKKVDLNKSIKNILGYKKYCDSLGIKFLFMPMPNKETIYYERVPFNEQPNYLLKLDSVLKRKNVVTINTLKIYNEYLAREKNKLLYHLDDTHWNSNATRLISINIIDSYNSLFSNKNLK